MVRDSLGQEMFDLIKDCDVDKLVVPCNEAIEVNDTTGCSDQSGCRWQLWCRCRKISFFLFQVGWFNLSKIAGL